MSSPHSRTPTEGTPGKPLPPWLHQTAELAGDALFAVRRFCEEAVEELRRRDRFFRWKAAVVATWVALSLAAVRIATAGPAEAVSNGLGAYVSLTRTAMGWGLLLDNRSDEAWTSVRVVLDDAWIHERSRVAPGEKVVLGPGQFQKGGSTAPVELEVYKVRISTNEGAATPTLVRPER